MDKLTEQPDQNRARRGAFSGPSSSAAAAETTTPTPTSTTPTSLTTPTTPTAPSPSHTQAQPSYSTLHSSHHEEGTAYVPQYRDATNGSHDEVEYHPFTAHDPLYYHPRYRKVVTWRQPTATVIPAHDSIPLPDHPRETRAPPHPPSPPPIPTDANLMPPPPFPRRLRPQPPQPPSILKPPTRTDRETLQGNLWAMMKLADRELTACHEILEATSQQCLQHLFEIDEGLKYLDALFQEDERQADMLRRYGRRHERSAHCLANGDVHFCAYRYGCGRGPRSTRNERRTAGISSPYRGGGHHDWQNRQRGLDRTVASGRVVKMRKKSDSMTGIAARIKLEYEDLKNRLPRRRRAGDEDENWGGIEGEKTEIETEEEDADDDDDEDYYDEDDNED